MSGHSKWATTKYRKAAQDKKRSALFSKLSRNIQVAAKEGGDPNPDNNAALAAAINKARAYSLPKDRIEQAIKKAFGQGSDQAIFENVVYEGYGTAGVAVLCEALTDNRNRTAAEVRAAFTHSGGNLGTTGSVAFQFERKGQIIVEKTQQEDEDEFMMLVADAGGNDYEDADEDWVVITEFASLNDVKANLEVAGIEIKGVEPALIPTTTVEVEPSDAKKVIRLIDKLEELEDIQNVYHTMEITEDISALMDE